MSEVLGNIKYVFGSPRQREGNWKAEEGLGWYFPHPVHTFEKLKKHMLPFLGNSETFSPDF